MLLVDLRVKDTVQPLLTSSDSKFDAVTDDGVADSDIMPAGVGADTVGVGDHLDPSRLPPAQRQLFMRIQQKQHRDDKPISDITAKSSYLVCLYAFFHIFVH